VAALDMLARREHCAGDLSRRLRDKGYDAALTAEVIGRLLAERLLDDNRYIDNFIRSHAARGHGPLRIRMELRQLDLTGPPVEDAIAAYPDWQALARAARLKKFGAKPPATAAGRAQQMRFLGYRGFTSAQVRGALGWDIDLGDVDDDP
jgi:regulatory protein